jgi:hypothetical protein
MRSLSPDRLSVKGCANFMSAKEAVKNWLVRRKERFDLDGRVHRVVLHARGSTARRPILRPLLRARKRLAQSMAELRRFRRILRGFRHGEAVAHSGFGVRRPVLGPHENRSRALCGSRSFARCSVFRAGQCRSPNAHRLLQWSAHPRNGRTGFLIAASLFKHQGFREEQEVRIVAIPNGKS